MHELLDQFNGEKDAEESWTPLETFGLPLH